MKAIFNNRLFVCVADGDTDPNNILLEPVDGTEAERIEVPLSDPTLIIDPTDEQYFAVSGQEDQPQKVGSIVDRQNYNEALADIAFQCGHAHCDGYLNIEDSRAFVSEMIRWADDFHGIHATQDWEELDYIETVDKFAYEKMRQYKAARPLKLKGLNWEKRIGTETK